MMRKLIFLLVCCVWLKSELLTSAAPPDPLERELAVLRDAGLATEDAALLDFLRKRTLHDDDRQKIDTLIKRLGDDSFEVREAATRDLIALGPAAEAPLKQAAESSDPEVKQRANFCLSSLAKVASSSVIQATVRVLAAHKPAGSTEALFKFLPFAADESTADVVHSALAKVAVKDGKPDKLLLDGLEDKLPAKRLGAALALYRTGIEEVRPAVIKLLKDPELSIRFRFAMLLGEAKERQAIPALIEMIPDVKSHELRQIEDLLERIAQDKAPKRPQDGADAKQIRDGWSTWWQDNSEKIDFAKLDLTPKVLGRTLILERLLNVKQASGRIYEIDKDGKTIWEIEGVRYPIDAKVIAEDRVLISESTTRTVTERNFKGEVLWQYHCQIAAYNVQRLPDGNTFLNCRNALIEVDKDGKEVFRHDLTANPCVAAEKLKSGDIAILSTQGQYTLLSPEKKELKSFKTEPTSIYGATVLPNGGVLVASPSAGKVLEYDPDGKVVWEAAIQGAMGASRLPNGNVLVMTVNGRAGTIIELDHEGKEVTKHATEGRPFRAYGR